MKKEKNIDNLFDKKLNDFEVIPNAKIWDNIEKKLDKKEERKKGIPFWLFGAVASVALLISVYTLINTKTQQPNTIENNVVTTENPIKQSDSSVVTNTDENKSSNTIPSNNDVVNQLISPKNPKTNQETIVTSPQKKSNSVNSFFINSREENIDGLKNDDTIKLKNSQKTQIASSENINIENKKQKTKKTSKKELQNPKKSQFAELKNKKGDLKPIKKEHLRWFVQPTVGALSAKSTNDNSIKGTQDDSFVAYGVKLGVQLNKKWSIQSGICSQEINSESNNNISVNMITSAINLDDTKQNNGATEVDSEIALSKDKSNPEIGYTITNKINVEQSFVYIEVPLEVKYKMLTINKFSTDLLLGGSSYFLTKNSASVNMRGTQEKGYSKNVEKINFSTNLGVDFNYQIHKYLKLNLNPIFKKSLTTSDKNFNNYQIGIYTGINYEF